MPLFNQDLEAMHQAALIEAYNVEGVNINYADTPMKMLHEFPNGDVMITAKSKDVPGWVPGGIPLAGDAWLFENTNQYPTAVVIWSDGQWQGYISVLFRAAVEDKEFFLTDVSLVKNKTKQHETYGDKVLADWGVSVAFTDSYTKPVKKKIVGVHSVYDKKKYMPPAMSPEKAEEHFGPFQDLADELFQTGQNQALKQKMKKSRFKNVEVKEEDGGEEEKY